MLFRHFANTCNQNVSSTIRKLIYSWNKGILVEYKYLAQGRINLLFQVRYLVEGELYDAVLRICILDSGPYSQSLGREVYLDEIVKRNQWNFFPRIYYYDDSRKLIPYPYTFMELINGYTLDENMDLEELFQVGRILGKIHKTSVLSFGKNPLEKDSIFGGKYYQKFYESAYELCKKNDTQMAEKFYEIYKKYYDEYTLNMASPTLIHHDFHSKNVVITQKKSIKVIDWDSSRGGIPEYDFVKMKYLNTQAWRKEQTQRFLDGYLSERPIQMDVNVCIYELCWIMRMYAFECNNQTSDTYYLAAKFYKDRFGSMCDEFVSYISNVQKDWRYFWQIR